MFRVQLPSRPWCTPALFSGTYRSQAGFWQEGFAYEISQSQADEMRSAVAEVSRLFVAAMDAVMADDQLLSKFIFSKDEKYNRSIRELAREAWQKERDKNYLFDRWDLAWDGIQPPKLLERNLSYLGLITGTGPVQEAYIGWLQKRRGYKDVETFGDLGKAIQQSFAVTAGEIGLDRRKRFPLITQAPDEGVDPGMLQAGKILVQWLRRAGFRPHHIQSTSTYLNAEGDMVVNRTFWAQLPGWVQKQIEARGHDVGHFFISSLTLYNRITASHAFLFADHNNYTASIATQKSDRAPEPRVASMVPYWSLVMGNKAMLAVMHQMFPDHPNLLPTYFGTAALKGTKRVLKLMDGCQAKQSAIVGADNRILRYSDDADKKLSFKKAYVTQAYCDAAEASFGQFRVFNVFTAQGKAAALSVREAPGPFVTDKDKGTKLLPVIVRPDNVITSLGRTANDPPPSPPLWSTVLHVTMKIGLRI